MPPTLTIILPYSGKRLHHKTIKPHNNKQETAAECLLSALSPAARFHAAQADFQERNAFRPWNDEMIAAEIKKFSGNSVHWSRVEGDVDFIFSCLHHGVQGTLVLGIQLKMKSYIPVFINAVGNHINIIPAYGAHPQGGTPEACRQESRKARSTTCETHEATNALSFSRHILILMQEKTAPPENHASQN